MSAMPTSRELLNKLRDDDKMEKYPIIKDYLVDILERMDTFEDWLNDEVEKNREDK